MTGALRTPSPSAASALRGLRIVVVGPREPPFQTGLLATGLRLEGADVERVAADPRVFPPFESLPSLRQRIRLSTFRSSLRAALARGADAVHVEIVRGAVFRGVAAAAVEEARAAGVRTVVRCLDSAADGLGRSLAGVDEVVVPSRYLRDELRARFGVEARLVAHLAEDSGIDPPPPRFSGRLRLVCARRLDAEHGLGLVLAAVAFAVADGADVQLVVVGDGPQRSELERIAVRTLPGRVEFRRTARREDRVEALRECDLLVDASRSPEFPEAVADALSLGVPVATAGTDGAACLVEHGRTGRVSGSGDPGGLARSIVAFHADRPALLECAWRAKIGALRWTWDAVRDDWAAAYRAS